MNIINSNTCYTCKCSFTRKQHYERHLTSQKHINNTISANKNQNYVCSQCNIPFKTEKSLQSHFSTKRHLSKIIDICPEEFVYCSCGNSYSCRQSLYAHRKTCSENQITSSVTEQIEQLQNAVVEERKLHQLEREQHQLERDELRAQIALLLDKYSTGNTTTNSHNNSNNKIENQNITININAFGNENLDYIDDKAIIECISRVYKSIPSLLEKIHFDPEHPENHNIKITNKKLPYASVMGNNKKWKTVDRKDAIETMVVNGYNILDEKYTESKDSFPVRKQQNFEGFQNKFESDDKELMKQLKTEVDMMILNGV